jgi:hypothetical protein
MIKKTASSEIFDLYASKMISKRSLSKVASAASILDELFEGAAKVGGRSIAGLGGITGLSPSVKNSVKVVSDAEVVDSKKLLQALVDSSRITESSEVIMRNAGICGYTETKIDDFLSKFSDDFKKMGDELNGLSPSPTQVEIDDFYTNNQKAIEYFKLLKTDTELKKALQNAPLGARHLAGGGTDAIGLDDAVTRYTAGGAAGAAGRLTTQVGNAISVGGRVVNTLVILGLGVLAYKGYKTDFVQAILSSFGSPESMKNIQAVKDAKDCINSIALIPGSPAVSARNKVLSNFDAFSKFEIVMNLTDRKEQKDTLDAASTAAQELISDSSTEGSIQHFLDLISKDPGSNLSGFSTMQAGGAGAVAGGLVGLLIKGKFGGVIGAAIGAVAGGWFMNKYYQDEINCIAAAGDAIEQFDADYREAAGNRTEEPQGKGPESTSGSEADTKVSVDSLLKQIITALQNDGIYNLPGLSNLFVNERRIIRKLIEESGSIENAATLISNVNPNIKLGLGKIDTSASQGKITKELLARNEVLQDLARDIVISARNVRRNLRQKVSSVGPQITTESKIKEDNMKKESKSINNQGLIRKAAESRVSYFGDANLGLKDQLTKSYYAGLTGMYNEQPTKRPSDYKDLYGFQEETGHDLMAESHPKSVTLADAMGRGGLVENNLEQQQKSIYVATTTPSGNFQSKYAQTVSYLEKLAKAADSQGKEQVSRIINQTIQKLK